MVIFLVCISFKESMKKDIDFPLVEGVSVAVVKSRSNDPEHLWTVYLLNESNDELHNVLIASKGYGYKEGEKQTTSVLRHLIEHVEPQSHVVIEPIAPALFHLYNEYWVSYYIGRKLYDKKFIFVPDSITEQNLTKIPQIHSQGILHD